MGRARNVKFFGIYDHDRAYGGPEEGGWWYDTYFHVKSFAFNNTNDMETEKHEKAMDRLINWMNECDGRKYPVHSVLSVGQYEWLIEDFPGEHETKEIPHYE